MSDWQDALAGERMRVDREFASRVRESPLSNQQWNLVMTAVEFEFEYPEDPERARIVADTDGIAHVLDEIRAVDQRRPGPAGGGGGGGGSGIFDAVKSAFGLGSDASDRGDLRGAAEDLATDYAAELQAHLEREGSFEQIRQRAAESGDG